MSRVLVALCIAIESGIAIAQPSPPPDEPPPSEPTTPPVVEPPDEPPALPPPPQPSPPAPDPIAACKQARHEVSVRAESISDSDARGRLLLQMPDCAHFDPAAFAKLEASWPAEPVASPIYHRTGLAFGVELELAEAALGVQLPSTHVFVGSQGSSTLLGVSLDLERISPGGMAPSMTIASIGPSLGLTLARSETGRSELLLGVAASYRIFDQIQAFDHRITGRVGPSFRYWLTPSFAAAVSANVRYDVLSDTSGNSQTTVAVGSALDLVGVF